MDTVSTTSDRLGRSSVARTVFEEAQMRFDRAAAQLDAWMTAAIVTVCDLSERHHMSLRDAAYLIAVDRTARACRERGWV